MMRRANAIAVYRSRRDCVRPDNLDRHAAERGIRAAYESRCAAMRTHGQHTVEDART